MSQQVATLRRTTIRIGWRPAAVALAGLAAVGLIWLFTASSAGDDALANAMNARSQQAAAFTGSLTRTADLGAGIDVQLILAAPALFQLTDRAAEAATLGADRSVVFIATENTHFGDLPHHFAPILRIDGGQIAVPTEVRVLTDATHHRTSAVIYGDVPAATLAGDHMVELLLPAAGTDRVTLGWRTPLVPTAGESSGLGLSLPALLALFGGLLASMWPCLFQLSAYFLPSVAGLSLAETEQGARRVPVLRTAVLFVSGIVIVYTVAGLVAGFAAQSLTSTTIFEDVRRPITVVAGLFVLAMALRIAVKARAPLVCKMPVLGMAGRFGNGPLGTMALGLAFATGCMTCFGAALVLGMFAYVFTTASPLAGGAILFLFSLGIAVPLVIAAVAMAKVLPLLGHLERNARWLSLASATIMGAYALLLISGNTHVLSDTAAVLAR